MAATEDGRLQKLRSCAARISSVRIALSRDSPVHDSQDPFVVTSPRDWISSSPPDRMLKARTLPKADNIILAHIVENTYSTDSPILIVW